MRFKIFFLLMLGLVYSGCNNNSDHHFETEHSHSDQDVKVTHEHEEQKVLLTAYNSNLELFAESDPFVVGEQNTVLSHFTVLSDFKPLDSASITLTFKTDQSKITTGDKLRAGIYSFKLTPNEAGESTLQYEVKYNGKSTLIEVPVKVYSSDADIPHELDTQEHKAVNSVIFTKEQSWRVEFKTELPEVEAFGQVIKTLGQVNPSQNDTKIISAKISGIIDFNNSNLVEGLVVSQNERLLNISGSTMAQNNSSVQYAEAKNNYETTKSTYERQKELAEDKIVSERELQLSRKEYENAKALFENLRDNFNASGQNISSPMDGYISMLYVKNGEYIEAGEPVLSIAKNKKLNIRAEIQRKYLPYLNTLSGVLVKKNDKIYSLQELNGRILAVGKNLSAVNYLIPITLEIENSKNFIPGEFVELFLKSKSEGKSLTIPNNALLEEQGLYFVFVQITPELFEKREVKIGLTDGLRTVITSGLSSDERIITKGAMMVKLSQASGALDPHAGHIH